MSSYEDFLKECPKNLCKKCGKCCRVAANIDYSYTQLKTLAAEGIEGAKDFIKIFEPYPSIEEARKVDAAVVDNIIEQLKDDNRYNKETLTFYKCKYLLPDNTCPIYEERPKLCRCCPGTAWDLVPPGCGFEGWLFLKREEEKEKVRKKKEELLDLKVMKLKTKDINIITKIEAVENKLRGIIELFEKHGSKNW